MLYQELFRFQPCAAVARVVTVADPSRARSRAVDLGLCLGPNLGLRLGRCLAIPRPASGNCRAGQSAANRQDQDGPSRSPQECSVHRIPLFKYSVGSDRAVLPQSLPAQTLPRLLHRNSQSPNRPTKKPAARQARTRVGRFQRSDAAAEYQPPPDQAWNELPQPQVLTALGFSNVKPRFSRPS